MAVVRFARFGVPSRGTSVRPSLVALCTEFSSPQASGVLQSHSKLSTLLEAAFSF